MLYIHLSSTVIQLSKQKAPSITTAASNASFLHLNAPVNSQRIGVLLVSYLNIGEALSASEKPFIFVYLCIKYGPVWAFIFIQ